MRAGQASGQHGQALGRCLVGGLGFQELHQLRSRAHGSAARVAIAQEESCQLCLHHTYCPSQPLSAQQWLTQRFVPSATTETCQLVMLDFRLLQEFPSSAKNAHTQR